MNTRYTASASSTAAVVAFTAAGTLVLATAALSMTIFTSAQTVMASTNSIGISANRALLPSFLSQTATTSSVSAASSWFDAPNRVQYRVQAFWSLLITSTSGTQTATRVPK